MYSGYLVRGEGWSEYEKRNEMANTKCTPFCVLLYKKYSTVKKITVVVCIKLKTTPKMFLFYFIITLALTFFKGHIV